jgi:aminomethyltransferase
VFERTELAMLAVQGPEARAKAAQLLSRVGAATALELDTFVGREIDGWFVARTGYTGEDGFEIMLPASDAERVWRELNALGVCLLRSRCARHAAPRGGHEPLRQRHGREHSPVRVGARMDGGDGAARAQLHRARGARENQGGGGSEASSSGCCWKIAACCAVTRRWWCRARRTGETTSGTFSPTLERSIAFARVPAAAGSQVQVDIRGKLLNARIVKPPFVRFGQALVQK